jgi:hypothetical protein
MYLDLSFAKKNFSRELFFSYPQDNRNTKRGVKKQILYTFMISCSRCDEYAGKNFLKSGMILEIRKIVKKNIWIKTILATTRFIK